MLIGSSEGAGADRGKLRVRIHQNLFDKIGQRAPRLRFGQVHVYTWGVGIESAIYEVFKGLAIHESGTYVNGTPDKNRIDILAAYNAVNDPDLSPDVGWAPTLFIEIQPIGKVPSAVQNDAGSFNW